MPLSRTRLSLSLLALLTLTATQARSGITRAGKTIQVTVDATKTQQKILRAHLTMPVKAGTSDDLLPKVDSRRARAGGTDQQRDGA
jgi:hypothetical protein